MLRTVLVVVWIVVAVASLIAGLEYYRMPVGERAFSELHAEYSPAGLVGHGYGIVGTAMIVVGVTGYSVRKRSARLARLGKLRQWLDVHIFLCTLGPFLVLLHTSFKFGGIVSIAFWSMTAVVLSGLFGRYVYVWIPKTLNGRFLSAGAVRGELDEVLAEIRGAIGSEADVERVLRSTGIGASGGALRTLGSSLRFRLTSPWRRRETNRALAGLGLAADTRDGLAVLAERRAVLERQILLLRPLQRMFRYWHAFHLPLALVMFLVLALHVAVAIVFGYTWVF